MSDPIDARAIEEELAELRAGYLRSLDGRVAALADACRQVAARRGDASALELAQREAHRLRGSAGLYGLRIVADEVERLERALQGDNASIAALVERVQRAAALASSGTLA